MNEKIEAMTPSTPAGGAVAWRSVATKGGYSTQPSWCPTPVSTWALADEQEGLCTIEYAYTTPPATVPVEAVLALVADWRKQAAMLRNEIPNLRDGSDKRFMTACDADTAADELESLTRGEK